VKGLVHALSYEEANGEYIE
jgi:hypothetical protein